MSPFCSGKKDARASTPALILAPRNSAVSKLVFPTVVPYAIRALMGHKKRVSPLLSGVLGGGSKHPYGRGRGVIQLVSRYFRL